MHILSLRLKKQIKKVLKDGNTFKTSNLRIIYSTNVDENAYLAISVAKKLGIAVKRNRAKRIIREVVRNQLTTPLVLLIQVKKIDLLYYEALQEFISFKEFFTAEKDSHFCHYNV